MLNVTPITQTISGIIDGSPMLREEVLEKLKEHPEVYRDYLKLTNELQEELVAFAMGVKGVKMTYDPFFKHVMDPIRTPDRVESLLSECLGEEVKIVEVLPNESRRITEDGSFIIADLLVRLKSGTLVNVEIQRIGYYFPGARCACYSSDLVMRQYSMVRDRCHRENKRFSYGDIQKVYTIVLMHQSTPEFEKFPNEYLHYAKQTFKSGLQMDLLQEYLLVPLDIFLNIPHNNINKLEAWLYFIASDKIEDIQKVCDAYPEFQELYREIFRFRYHPKELVSMFSETLRILDQNTIQYMIDDMKKRLGDQMQEIEGLCQELADNELKLESQKKQLEEKNQELESQSKKLEEKNQELESQSKQLEEKNQELESQSKQLEEKNQELESQSKQLEEKNQEVIEMRQELERLRIQLATLKKEL